MLVEHQHILQLEQQLELGQHHKLGLGRRFGNQLMQQQ